MRTLSASLIGLALVYLGFVLFLEASRAMHAEVVDQSHVVLLFGSLVLVGLVGGAIVVVTLLPAAGDWVGNFFFNPNQPIAPSPHAAALAAVARGDYAQAVAEYRQCLAADPNDTHALSEIVHLYCDKLADPEAAERLLEDALERGWAPDDSAFLTHRLADVYWNHQHDPRRARELLLQVIGNFPGSRHAANATHRLQEIERELAAEG